MEAFYSLLALAGMGYAAFRGMKLLARSGKAQARHDQPLTPADLRLLEESAARLVADIQAAADECVARIDTACARAEQRIRTLDSAQSDTPDELLTLIQAGQSCAQVARAVGMTTGEVELVQGLKSMAATAHS